MHREDGVSKLGAKGELSVEESNQKRIAALNAIGVGVNGINESRIMMALEELLGPDSTERVNRRHAEWLADQLDGLEAQVLEQQRKQSLTIPGR